MKRLGFAIFVGLQLAAVCCKKQQSFVEPEPGLERMQQQPRVDHFESSAFYTDGMGMRPPPRGTIPVEQAIGDPKIILGLDGADDVDQIPIPINLPLVARGRERFEILCAACHGVAGDGDTVVAANMDQRKPPSLHEDRIRAFRAGRLYRVIRSGYGLMPSYASVLSVEERWAVVAYVRALQLSRNALVANLPVDIRSSLEREAR
jgi:mono/diheme cytochrome c family protein